MSNCSWLVITVRSRIIILLSYS